MRINDSGRWVSIFCLFALTISTGAATSKNPTAQQCGVDQDRPAQRIFADPDGKRGWHEYQTVSDVPELDSGFGQFAKFWAGRDGDALISLEEPTEDFIAYTDYCFDKAGRIMRLRFELRTAWGWGYREEGPVVNGALVRQTSEFFSTKDEAKVARPDQANDVADALKPHLYQRKSELPFSTLLSK
jgi:hypothetical protein